MEQEGAIKRTSERSTRSTERKSFKSKKDLQNFYISRAKVEADRHAAERDFPIFASCSHLGRQFGVGIGLYFKILYWLQVLFFIMTLLAVPYYIVINNSVFTDEYHKEDHTFGIKIYDTPELYSFTFAAIVDSSKDNDTLQYMNTEIAGVWKGPMTKATFLTWISLVDAGIVVLLLATLTFVTLMSNKFIKSVDAKTIEVSDYTVLVRGLPANVSPQEVGDYFSRWGEVMDVVLVRDMRPVLDACARASHLEQKRILMTDQLRLYKSAIYKERAEKADKKMGKVGAKMEKLAKGGGPDNFPVKAAFVTFNREAEQSRCLEALPHGFWRALFRPRIDRLRGKHSLYVQKAYAPEDYIHENIPCSWFGRFMRRTLSRFVVLLILVVTAAIITRLSTMSITESRRITWQNDAVRTQLQYTADSIYLEDADKNSTKEESWVRHYGNNTLYVQNLNTTKDLYSLYQAAISTAQQRTGSSGMPSNDARVAAAVDYTGFCKAELSEACQPFYINYLNISHGFNLNYGQMLTWNNQAEQLINQRPLLRNLTSCDSAISKGEYDVCVLENIALPSCMACYCKGLSTINIGNASTDLISTMKSQCDEYVDSWNLKSWALRISVSVVIAAINYALRVTIEYLVVFEKHWTLSEQHKTYAFVVFLAQVLNSALVLMLVNASPAASASRHSEDGILKYLVLNGQYNDFTPSWYVDVGISIMVLVIIQAFSPIINVLADCAYKGYERCLLVRCTENASQVKYDEAFARPDYELAYRVVHTMLVITVTFMFGSGMPILYVLSLGVFVIANLVERHALTRVCNTNARYSEMLPNLVITIMPWGILIHCLFGIWMHTYFKVIATDGTSSLLSSLSASASSNMQGTSTTGQAITVQQIAQRITSANGIALLVCAAIIITWMLFRYFLWHICGPIIRAVINRCCCAWCRPLVEDGDNAGTPYEVALMSGSLKGTATYRLPHHPRYASVFNGKMHRAIWIRAQGIERYTRVVSNHGGHRSQIPFTVAPEVIREANMADLETGKMPTAMANMVTKLASSAAQSGNLKVASRGGSKTGSMAGSMTGSPGQKQGSLSRVQSGHGRVLAHTISTARDTTHRAYLEQQGTPYPNVYQSVDIATMNGMHAALPSHMRIPALSRAGSVSSNAGSVLVREMSSAGPGTPVMVRQPSANTAAARSAAFVMLQGQQQYFADPRTPSAGSLNAYALDAHAAAEIYPQDVYVETAAPGVQVASRVMYMNAAGAGEMNHSWGEDYGDGDAHYHQQHFPEGVVDVVGAMAHFPSHVGERSPRQSLAEHPARRLSVSSLQESVQAAP